MVGTFRAVDPVGTYLRTSASDHANAATDISISSLGATEGDYVGLLGSGKFIYDHPNNNTSQSMIGCFFDGRNRKAPGEFGTEESVNTVASFEDGVSTDVPQDFNVRFDERVFVRIPKKASSLKLGPNDSYFGDNRSLNYGALVTLPNINPAKLVESPVIDDDDHEVDLALPLRDNIPKATKFTRSHVDDGGNDHLSPQWRGWYKSNPGHWNPKASSYGDVRVGSDGKPAFHGGWDIFAPKGSKLRACVGPAWLDILDNPGGYGSIAAMRFKWRRKTYTLIYAHCDSIVGSAREIQAGEIIATAGCSGNSADQGCGTDLANGGRTDHVHIGLFEGTKVSGRGLSPDTLLSWSIR